MPNPVATRFAPSPTGLLHVGGLRTALYAYLYAKQQGGKFYLRIEDTDQSRKVAGAEENIVATLQQFGLNWDNAEPIRQSERLALYREHAAQLVAAGAAYPCFCTSERLEQLRATQTAQKLPTRYDGHCRNLSETEISSLRAAGTTEVVRLAMPTTGTTSFVDAVRGTITFANDLVDDQVLMKSDGFPTYHLASVVDDHDMGITHVIRGEEWLSSTPKHLRLYEAFGWEAPVFAHLPLLLNADRSKLSKRQGDVAVQDYLDKGYLPEALLNFVLLLGWNPGTNQEVFNLPDMLAAFSLERIHKAGAVFDLRKLDWLNSEYIRTTDLDRLVTLCGPYLTATGATADQALLRRIVATERSRLTTLAEVRNAATLYLATPEYAASLLLWKTQTPAAASAALNFAATELDAIAEPWDGPTLERHFLDRIAATQQGKGDVLWPLRVALSGKQASPGPLEIAAVLGKTETQARIQLALKKLAA